MNTNWIKDYYPRKKTLRLAIFEKEDKRIESIKVEHAKSGSRFTRADFVWPSIKPIQSMRLEKRTKCECWILWWPNGESNRPNAHHVLAQTPKLSIRCLSCPLAIFIRFSFVCALGLACTTTKTLGICGPPGCLALINWCTRLLSRRTHGVTLIATIATLLPAKHFLIYALRAAHNQRFRYGRFICESHVRCVLRWLFPTEIWQLKWGISPKSDWHIRWFFLFVAAKLSPLSHQQ